MEVKSDTNSKRLLSAKQAAAFLAISERTLHTLKKEKKLQSVKVGSRSVRYDLKDLETFIENYKR